MATCLSDVAMTSYLGAGNPNITKRVTTGDIAKRRNGTRLRLFSSEETNLRRPNAFILLRQLDGELCISLQQHRWIGSRYCTLLSRRQLSATATAQGAKTRAEDCTSCSLEPTMTMCRETDQVEESHETALTLEMTRAVQDVACGSAEFLAADSVRRQARIHRRPVSQLKGGCQTWLSHLTSTHGVDVADLKDKISWEELTRLWKKRFIVDDAPALAINHLFAMTEGNTATRDWLTEWQKIAATPDLDLPFSHLRREFYNSTNSVDGRQSRGCRPYAYIAKIDRKFKTQRYDDIDAPLLYVRIQIGEATCNALIDCGASRNYISQDFMVRAGLGPRVRRKSQPTQVTLADGHTHKSIDRCIDDVPVYFAPHASEAVSFDILDTKFDMILGMSWLRSEDHPVNFYRRTVHVRDRNGVLVPCTVAPPHPSISCHVVSTSSMRASIIRDDIEEMGVCFLHALRPHDASPTDSSSDPRITELLDAYGDVFEGPHGVVPDRPIRYEIILEDGAVPPRGCIYRMSEEGLSVLRAQLDDLLEKGWIRPSSSPYGVPVLFVRKKNKDLRLCIDYRKLNAQTIRNAGPLPRIDDLLERLGGAKFFSKLDLKSGYHQLEIRKEDRYKTAFKTRYGHFEWLVMPFGLTNAPTTFQAAMTTEFRHMLDRFILIYLDDILVYSRSLDEHVEHMRTVLERLRQAKYKANRDKCEFARQELEYLGHYVTPQGIRPLADKIEALCVWPEPTNTTDVLPPINSLDDARKKELLAFVMALKRWRHFLLGRRRFTWVTDNNPLTYYKTQDTVSSTIGQWMCFIDQFDFTPKHLPGLSNHAADALSRRPDLCAMTHHAFAFDEELQRHFIRGYESDPDFATLYAQLSSDHPPASHYRIADGYLLLHSRGKDLLCVPRDRRLRTRLLGEYHDSRLTGHFGVNRTIARLRQRFRWPDLVTDVTRYCDSCEVCRRSKPHNRNPYGELHPMPIPREPGLSIAMDVTGPFPRDRLGHDGILTVVDRLSFPSSTNAAVMTMALSLGGAMLVVLSHPDLARAALEEGSRFPIHHHQHAGLDSDLRALALGPGGPLMEDFWDNMRRYVLYFFTVATGGLYTLVKPLADLLRRPATAVLVVVIATGVLYLTYTTVNTMLGLNQDFDYLYSQ
ncbi:hypothetical protein CBR_g31098 [Chara braunii]|uniref:Uncharacterized protein ycf33 n=1 Tax=Chara braunii TaxID=69332 RepID=A0A388LEB0_CHABU|nr:hypothetical protein CBR_g31098 [Chara braunii]|eukprot:GBG80638.1 hypothetical protein CBR_g31098 [Chara braunii]